MKRQLLTRLWVACAAAVMLCAQTVLTEPAEDRAEAALKAAMDKEVIEGDLKGAIEQFKKVAQSKDRSVAARALVRLAESYQKLGDAQAKTVYEQLVREFGDQKDAVAIARARLAALGVGHATLGGETVRKVWSNWSGMGPRLSRDGRFVAYLDFSTNEIALFDVTTGERRNVTNHGMFKVANGHPENPIFSPDGKWVAYEMDLHGGKTEIRLNRIEAPQMRKLHAAPEGYGMTLLDWAVDGKWILARLDADRSHAVEYGELSAADGNWRSLLKFTEDSFDDTGRISKDGASFAYDREGDIHIAAVDGTRRSLLVGGIAKDHLVDWSPDGKSLLFTSDRGSRRGLWRIRMENMAAVGEPEILKADLGSVEPVNIAQDGTILGENWQKKSDAWMAALDPTSGKLADTRALVTNTPAGLTEFAGWSPDGSKAAAIGFKTLNAMDGRTLVIRPTRGGVETRIDLDGPVAPSPSPRWASVGNQLLVGVSSDPGGPPGTVDVQTGRVTKVNIPAKFTSGDGVFSPDGRRYFAATRARGEVASILMYDTVSKTEKEILLDQEAWLIRGLSPSPDGKRLAYSVSIAVIQNGKKVSGGESRLRVLDVESGMVTEVAVVRTSWWGSRLNTAWTPDGRSLIFAREDWEGADAGKSGLFIVPSAGGEPKPISPFEEGRTFDLGVSPDGKMLGYTHFKEAGNLWLMQNVLPRH